MKGKDAREKLRDRLVKMWAALPTKDEVPLITHPEFTEMCVRAELERAAQVVANMHGESATKCASAIRKLKE